MQEPIERELKILVSQDIYEKIIHSYDSQNHGNKRIRILIRQIIPLKIKKGLFVYARLEIDIFSH